MTEHMSNMFNTQKRRQGKREEIWREKEEGERKDSRRERPDVTVSSPDNTEATSTKFQPYSHLQKTRSKTILTDGPTHKGKSRESPLLCDNHC